MIFPPQPHEKQWNKFFDGVMKRDGVLSTALDNALRTRHFHAVQSPSFCLHIHINQHDYIIPVAYHHRIVALDFSQLLLKWSTLCNMLLCFADSHFAPIEHEINVFIFRHLFSQTIKIHCQSIIPTFQPVFLNLISIFISPP